MGAAMTLSTPQDQVDQLIQQVADEEGLDIIDQLKDLNPTAASISASKSREHQKEDDLSRRFVSIVIKSLNKVVIKKLYKPFVKRGRLIFKLVV